MIDHFGVRRFTDDEGVLWEVWEAHPRLAERRRLRDRRTMARASSADRRVAPPDTVRPLADAAGWLVLRSDHEHRRRTPIRDGWELMPDYELLGLLHRSRITAPYPRVRRTSDPRTDTGPIASDDAERSAAPGL